MKKSFAARGAGGSSPWRWIPTLYVAEGLPYFAVNTLTALMYVNLGLSKAEMAFYTGWLYLPWVIKPFWSPFVDLFSTKRSWTILMELLMALCMAAVAFALPGSAWLSLTLAAFWLMAFFSATHDIAADGYYMLELDPKRQAAYVGLRSTFYRLASVLGQGGLVIMAGKLEEAWGDVPKAWGTTFAALSALFLLITVYHSFFMPRAPLDRPVPGVTAKNILQDFGMTFVTFFRKPGIWIALTFMLLYRLPEALCIKLIQPFLVDDRALGGLGLSTARVGVANGTVGVIALLAGGIIGGLAIARGGLRRWIWPMALALTLPCFLYCLLAMSQPQSFLTVCTAIGIEQFGYGFGFTAYMLYLMYFSQGEAQTSHYAFCTAFMAIGMMLPGMAAGWIFEQVERLGLFGSTGYAGFFWIVMLACLATFLAVALARPGMKRA
ncbi:MAG: MFS transporter [Muribaculaceae bacterium]|nr:MFS transporter [Muribaculaceae bacterium]